MYAYFTSLLARESFAASPATKPASASACRLFAGILTKCLCKASQTFLLWSAVALNRSNLFYTVSSNVASGENAHLQMWSFQENKIIELNIQLKFKINNGKTVKSGRDFPLFSYTLGAHNLGKKGGYRTPFVCILSFDHWRWYYSRTRTPLGANYFISSDPHHDIYRFVTGKSSGILSDISSGIRSGILFGISSGILPGISSGICSGISSGNHKHCFCQVWRHIPQLHRNIRASHHKVSV